MSKVWPASQKVMAMPMSRPMSPVRVVKNALRAASEFGLSSHQWPMSMNEHTPMPSHPSRQLQGGAGRDHDEHGRGEQRQGGEVVGVAPVAPQVLERVHVDHQRDEADDEQQHHGEAVDVDPEPGRVGDSGRRARRDMPVEPGEEVVLDELADAVVAAALQGSDDPGDGGEDGQDEGGADGGDADLGALVREALAEQQDDHERCRRQRRDEPRVAEEPVHGDLSPSSCRPRRGRSIAGCGR